MRRAWCKPSQAAVHGSAQSTTLPPPRRSGGKLDYAQASSLLFTLNVILGNYQHPLTSPDANFLAEGSATLAS